jgi:hypothetical protein
MSASAPYVMWLNLVIFNLAIIFLLRLLFRNIDIKEVLREKAPNVAPQSAAAGAAAPDNTSYSRVTGLIGAVVLAAFFWALGNIILFKAFESIAEVAQLVSAVTTYILAGAALFAPYAVNQLTNIFKS